MTLASREEATLSKIEILEMMLSGFGARAPEPRRSMPLRLRKDQHHSASPPETDTDAPAPRSRKRTARSIDRSG
jgi:hypothetical protein